MTVARVQIAVTDLDREVVVNGEDITAMVSRVVVDAAAGPHLPVVTVQFARPDFVFEGEGIVQVASDLDEAAVIAGFLDSLDPDELEREALSGTNLGQSTGLLFVEALHRLAKGGLMTLEAFLTRGQDRIQLGMLDSCRIVNGITSTFDATAGVSVEVDGPVVYTGRCKIKPAETTVNERTEGDADYAHRVYEAHLPIDAPVVPRGAYLIVTSTRDLALTGARFIVRDTAASTLAVQRKLFMERDR